MTAPTPIGGDMTDDTGIARAHLESLEEIAATPTDIEVDAIVHVNPEQVTGPKQSADVPAEPINMLTAYKQQHAKVLRFEISVGKDDDDRTIEQFEADLRDALALMKPGYHNLTVQGSYYIIDGKVCAVADYDPVAKNRKPGTYPPQWAGGPKPGEKPPPVYGDDPADQPSKRVKGSKESVAALAEGINKQVKAKSKKKLADPEADPASPEAREVIDVELPK